MVTADQLIAHAFGDYVLQSDWMANEKAKKSVAAVVHALTYALPFLFFRPSWQALAVIVLTHFLIDRFRLARYVCWIKNFLSPPETLGEQSTITAVNENFDTLKPGAILKMSGSNGATQARIIEVSVTTLVVKAIQRWWRPWAECKGTGYPSDRPPFMAVWLMIITDNLMHVTINALALMYL